MCSILETIREVTTCIQVGPDGLLSQTISYLHELTYVLRDETVGIIDWKHRRGIDASSAKSNKVRPTEKSSRDALSVCEVAVGQMLKLCQSFGGTAAEEDTFFAEIPTGGKRKGDEEPGELSWRRFQGKHQCTRSKSLPSVSISIGCSYGKQQVPQ